MSLSLRSLASLVLAAAALTAHDAAAQIPCKLGSSWAIPGSGHPGPVANYLEAWGGDELQNPTGISIDLWFYLDYDVVPTTLVAKGPVDFSGPFSYLLDVTEPKHLRGTFALEDPNNPQSSVVLVSVHAVAPAVAKKTWHRVVLTFDSETGAVRIYLDGELMDGEGSGISALKGRVIRQTPHPLHIGGSPYVPAKSLLGAVDEVRIWTRALSAEEIQATASAPLDGAEGLAASFHFDGTLLDLTGGHVATNVGVGSFQGKCASFGNYGQGIPGTNGEVPLLWLDDPPVAGKTRFLLVGNPTGHGVPVLLGIGTKPTQVLAFGGTMLVEPLVTTVLGVPPLGFGLSFKVPAGNGVVFLQSFLPDAGAVHGVAASPGLFLHIGK